MAWSEDGTAVFAFRGTSKQQDAWQDLKLLRRGIPFLEEKYPGVKAHVGALLSPPAGALVKLSLVTCLHITSSDVQARGCLNSMQPIDFRQRLCKMITPAQSCVTSVASSASSSRVSTASLGQCDLKCRISPVMLSCRPSSPCAGFQQQLSAVLNADDVEHNIGEALMKLSGGRQPNRVICTGHSLGGALATLCAPWCAIEYPKADIRCVTFGSPRVGAQTLSPPMPFRPCAQVVRSSLSGARRHDAAFCRVVLCGRMQALVTVEDSIQQDFAEPHGCIFAGNNKFKAAFHALVGTSLRVVYNGDPIPTMPPAYKCVPLSFRTLALMR